ncbi:MFS general substrate transporter [Sistotremastrum niveocremeum HHB9708]|uniref:MFS general substrate transporter n=1 Tax=Sistotremastrum niveocremeum HHB9708 TaxID=1314777 RepID=A0A164T8E8_9AGAM|nr:MFS general substrate transporter [Sistotremastrum niveocremeum HHB9708]
MSARNDMSNTSSSTLDESKTRELHPVTLDILEAQRAGPDAINSEDEGFRSWLTVFGAFLVQATTIGHTGAYGVYEAFYKEHYLSNSSSSAISWVGSTQYSLVFALGLVGGLLFDRGKFRSTFLFSVALYIFSNFMLSLARPQHFYQIFLSQGLGMGVAMGLLYSPTFMIVGAHFHRRRTLAMGILTCGAAFGGIIQPIILNQLFSSSLSFGNSIRCDAAINAVMLIIACLSITIKKPKLPQADETRKTIHIFGILRQRDYLLGLIAGNFICFPLFFPAVYIQLYSTTLACGLVINELQLTILNASSILGRVIFSILAARYGNIETVVLTVFGLGATLFGLLGVSSVASEVVVIFILGLFLGGVSALQPSVYANTAKSQPHELGARLGIPSLAATIPCLIGPPIDGAFLTDKFQWWRPIVFVGILTMLGGALYLSILLWPVKGNSGAVTATVTCPSDGGSLEEKEDGDGQPGNP